MPEDFSPHESLQLIQSMIDKTKANLSENRFYFLLWGWIAFAAIIGQFMLKVVVHYRHHYIVWLLTFAGVFVSILHAHKQKSRQNVRTYIGDSMRYLWLGMGVTFFVLSFIISKNTWFYSYPFFIMLYGLGTFVSGKILQFKPLVIGGVIAWVLACIATFFDFDYQMLFSAAAILISYIIPGYLLPNNKQ
jgi:hypothetical protein